MEKVKEMYAEFISIDPEVRSGKPCVRGTRIAVADVMEYLNAGMSKAELRDDFPKLSIEAIEACIAFSSGR